ncbi:hypothetical protein [uncultured Treponema sp.]|uniref:hypothetical protein n=1 Tax=uncultured Treponema sp. TaxID=162155 RepID=UPI0025977190|nr:hypothetical protein [uncultured Treponema sp.]
MKFYKRLSIGLLSEISQGSIPIMTLFIIGAKQWVLRTTALSDAEKEGRLGGKETGD